MLALLGRRPNARIVLTRITWVEVLSALSRLQREGAITKTALSREARALEKHFRYEYQVVELNRTTTKLAGKLVQRHPLRAYDAVQLASALRLRENYRSAENASFTFVTSDIRLSQVATSEGLFVFNPVEQS